MLTSPHMLTVGVAAFVGSVLGVQLGNATISAIKPNFFLGAAVHPRDRGKAIDPREIEARRLARLQSRYDSLYGWEEGNRALQAVCGNCQAPASHAVAVYDARVPYFGSLEEQEADERREDEEIDRRYQARLEPLEVAENSPALPDVVVDERTDLIDPEQLD